MPLPTHEATALQRGIDHNLRQLVREFADRRSATGQSLTPHQLLEAIRGESRTVREALDSHFAQLGDQLESFTTRLEWSLSAIHDELADISRLLRIPTETRAREHLTNAHAMAGLWIARINGGELSPEEGESLFLAASERYREAVHLMPQAETEYASRVGQAELNLVAGRNDVATQLLRESISFAVKRGDFDPISYSCRLLGRIAFATGDNPEAVRQLTRATSLSPGYAVGRYDYACYLAECTQTEAAIAALRRAIELNTVYWYLAEREPHFAAIQETVERLRQELLEEARRECLGICAKIVRETTTPSMLAHYTQQISEALSLAHYSAGSPPAWYESVGLITDAARASQDIHQIHTLYGQAGEISRRLKDHQMAVGRFQKETLRRAKGILPAIPALDHLSRRTRRHLQQVLPTLIASFERVEREAVSVATSPHSAAATASQTTPQSTVTHAEGARTIGDLFGDALRQRPDIPASNRPTRPSARQHTARCQTSWRRRLAHLLRWLGL